MTNEAKCSCQYCNGHIAFPKEMAGQSINCPHCQLETLLFIPPAAAPLKQPPPTRKNTNAVRLLVVAIILAAGFAGAFLLKPLLLTKSQKQTEQSKPTNLKPVVGAFGWKLGDKLPENLRSAVHGSVFGPTYDFQPEEGMAPFDQIELEITGDGLIYCVRATGYAPDYKLNASACKETLISLLSEKYGLRQHIPHNEVKRISDTYGFGADDQWSRLGIFEQNLFTLEYFDEHLRTIALEEQDVKRRKEDADRKSTVFDPKYLQASNQAAETAKRIAEEVKKVTDKYNSAEEVAKRLAQVTKDRFEHERKMAEYGEQGDMARAGTAGAEYAVRKKYSDIRLDISRRERDEELKQKMDEAANLEKEAKRLQAEADAIRVPSKEHDEALVRKSQQEAEAAKEWLKASPAQRQ
jgi:hypothetical protein